MPFRSWIQRGTSCRFHLDFPERYRISPSRYPIFFGGFSLDIPDFFRGKNPAKPREKSDTITHSYAATFMPPHVCSSISAVPMQEHSCATLTPQHCFSAHAAALVLPLQRCRIYASPSTPQRFPIAAFTLPLSRNSIFWSFLLPLAHRSIYTAALALALCRWTRKFSNACSAFTNTWHDAVLGRRASCIGRSAGFWGATVFQKGCFGILGWGGGEITYVHITERGVWQQSKEQAKWDPNWAICYKNGQNFSRIGRKNLFMAARAEDSAAAGQSSGP